MRVSTDMLKKTYEIFITFLFLDCEKTFFGMNCSQKCNIRCLNQDCHHETGECVDNEKVSNLPLKYLK